MRIAYTPDFDVFPVDPRISKVVSEAVGAFKEAGATVEEVKLGIKRDQRELSDLWCRLIAPLSNVAFDRMRKSGFDVLGEHRDDFPPEFLHWIDKTAGMTVIEQAGDQEMRTEILDAIQGVFADYDLIVGPTLTAMQVKNGTDGNTLGPAEVNGIEIDRCIGWCPTYLTNFTGNPAASIPAGLADGLPVGLQIMGRRYADADVLAASAAFERIRPWHDTYATPANRSLS
jgi:amidase/aspartyl-tRNA(Asn)/glutamyl-tRNA(Gln) amidotransferase subunit A